jgi:hypothetical protein
MRASIREKMLWLWKMVDDGKMSSAEVRLHIGIAQLGTLGPASPARQIVKDGKPVQPGGVDDPRSDERAPWE